MDFTRTNLPEKKSWRLDTRSFALGLALTVLPVSLTASAAGGFDLGSLGNIGKLITDNVKSLVGIKKNLDVDVKNLAADAKILFSDKDNLLAIKDQLSTLATQTRQQIDGITKLVGEVESHINSTQAHITDTASHVNEIDNVRTSLTGAKK